MNSQPDHVLDLTETVLPLALLKIGVLFKKMRINETAEVFGHDSETKEDILKVLPADCCEVTAMDVDVLDKPLYRLLIRKTGSAGTL